MKKFLSATLALMVAILMGALVACGDKETGTKTNDAEIAQKAIAALNTMYGDKEGSVTDTSYPVNGQINVGGKMYAVTWTVSSDFANYGNYIVVGEMNANKQVPITITKATEDINYTLTATVTVGKTTKSVDYTRKVSATKATGDEQIEVSIDLSAAANRKSFTATTQVWEQNGIKLTNTGSVGDYTNPIRLYKSTKTTIEYPGMLILTFHSDKEYDDNPYVSRLKAALEATGLGTVTIDEEVATDIIFTLTAITDSIEFTTSEGQCRVKSIDVVANKNGSTDEQKATAAAALLDLATKRYIATGTYDLPATQGSATVTWAVKGESANVAIEGGKLKVNSLPATDTEVTLTATLTVGEATATKDIKITVAADLGLAHAGTLTDPYSIADIKKIGVGVIAGKVYVKGYVVATGTHNTSATYDNWKGVYIVDEYSADKNASSTDAIQVYRLNTDGTFVTADGLTKGDCITVYGYIAEYGGNIQISYDGSDDPVVVALTPAADDRTDAEKVAEAKAAITLSKTTFTKLDEEMTLPAKSKNLDLTWAVKGTSDLIEIAGGKLKVKVLPTTNTTVTITATVTSGEVTETRDFDITVEAAVVDTTRTLKLALLQGNIGKKLYFKGTINSNNFGETTENVAEAADVVIAEVTGGYTFKVGTQYLELNDNHRLTFVDTPTGAWVYDEEKSVYTWTVSGVVYYLGSYSTFDTISASAISYLTNSGNYAARFEDPANRTDAQKIADALALINATLANITAIGEVTLPAPVIDGVTLAWALATDNTATGVELTGEGKKLNVTALPTEDATVKLVVTASCGTATAQTKNVSVKIEAPVVDVNYGTLEAPLTVTEALALADEQCKANNDVTKQVVYMTGIVSDAGTNKTTYYENVYLKDASKSILVYRLYLEGATAPVKNDVLVICGYITNYNGTTIEFAYKNNTNVILKSNTRGTSNITLTAQDGATVTGLDETATNGTEVTFTVEIAAGKKLVAVKLNGDEITAVDGSYTFTVAGDMTVVINTADEGLPNPETLYTLTASKTGGDNGYATKSDLEVNGITWSVEGNSTMNPWRFGGKNLTGVDRHLTGKTAITGKVTEVVIKFGTANLTVNSVTFNVYNTNPTIDGATVAYTATVTFTADGWFTIIAPADANWTNCYYELVFNVTAGGSNSYVCINTITFTGYASTATTSENAVATVSLPEAIIEE